MLKMEEPIYLDYNSTTPLDPQVVQVMSSTMVECWANPSSDSELGRKAKSAIDLSRFHLSKMIGCKEDEIVFTSGGTEASNMIIRSCVDNFSKIIRKRPHVITTTVEHDATSKLLQHLIETSNLDVTFVGLEKNGTLSASKIVKEINESTCLITIMLANNETGILFPVKEIGSLLKTINKERKNKVFLHSDAAQAIGKVQVDVNNLGVDYLTIVGHKFYGPRIGCVYYKQGSPLIPLLFGGGQEKGLRSGTENTPCIAGLGEAAKIVYERPEIESHLLNLRRYFEDKIKETFLNDAKINFEDVMNRLPNTISLCFPGKNGREILKNCKRVVASTGAACHAGQMQPSAILMGLLSYEEALGTLRLSVGRETTTRDIDDSIQDFIESLRQSQAV